MTLENIVIYVVLILLLIFVWNFMKIPIVDLSPPRLLKAGSIIFFAMYPITIKLTEKYFTTIDEHLNFATFILACWILIVAEIKEVSIFNADRAKLSSVKTTADATQSAVNSVKTTADATQSAVNSVKTTADTTQSAVNLVKTTADTTQRTVNSVKATADATQSAVNSVKAKMEDIDKQFSDLDDKIDNLPSKLTPESQDSSSEEAGATQKTVNLVKTKVENISKQFSDLNNKIRDLPSKLILKSQEIVLPSKFYITMVLIACSVFISIVIGASMLHTKQVFFDKTNSILQQNSTNVAGILTQVSGLDTKITKIDSLQKQMQEQKEMKTLLDQIQYLSKKIDSQQFEPKPSDQDSSSTEK